MYIEKLKEMFNEMVIKKDASTIPIYYHPDFLLYTNEETMSYAAFLEFHEKCYTTPIQYAIEYDEETLLEQGGKVARWLEGSGLQQVNLVNLQEK